ncbi:MAG: N(4)-(beta-N-acetylglucosaminyl)-L-asparaginase [Balneolaceae bacterium]|nr:N(4)-(beta-N-acetylglucosaminyl)-L-asparaginase [Balneolaceae bacterium]
MINRKEFLKTSLMGGLLPTVGGRLLIKNRTAVEKPVVISTWNNQKANEAAWKILEEGGSALNAVEAGARVPEADPDDRSVGLGGLPDASGRVTLDACIMDHRGRCGSVAFLEHILHPVSVARKVMEETPHVMLVGEGAYRFAREQGFEKEILLTRESREAWLKWKKEQGRAMSSGEMENHDTIGILALDDDGNLSGACTTSGTGYKLRGRVGDSPLIGAGLFVDNEVGAATATGVGEEVIRVAGSHLVVELMRQGKSPEEACREAVGRIVDRTSERDNLQVGFLALNKQGEYGGFSVRKGYSYTLRLKSGVEVIRSSYWR